MRYSLIAISYGSEKACYQATKKTTVRSIAIGVLHHKQAVGGNSA
ncbi:hypothetical protein MY5147_008009 [Beauveria neobassiana]